MRRCFSFSLGLLILSISTASFAQDATTTTTTTVKRQIIVSPAPQGTCTTVAAHWDGTSWVSEHSICRYVNRTEGAAWVQDYWACSDATNGTCSAWQLVPGHWVQTLP